MDQDQRLVIGNIRRHKAETRVDFFINMAKTVKSFPLQEQIHIFQIEMRLATTPTNPVSNPTTSGSKVKIVSNIMLSPAPTSSNSIFPQPTRSNSQSGGNRAL